MIIRYSELIGKNAEIFFREIPNLGKPVISLFSAYGCFQSMLLDDNAVFSRFFLCTYLQNIFSFVLFLKF